MAHELSICADGRAEMAYAGDVPWHGLGQQVTKGASVGVWMKEAGMDWEAKESRVFYEHPQARAVDQGPLTKLDIIDSHKVLYRSDTGAPLGIVGKDYNVVQPRDVLEFFRHETERSGWYIHTAGVLKGGRKLWAMATNGREEGVVSRKGKRGDRVKNHLLLATSLDGSMKTTAKLTSEVVVCHNTLVMALREAGSVVTVSHRSVFDPRSVKRALGVAEDTFETFMAQARDLAETPIKLDEAMDVLERVFGKPPAQPKGAQLDTSWLGDLSKLSEPQDEDEEDPRVSRSVARCLELFKGAAIGGDLDGRKDSQWGLLNAVTQYVDHEMGRTQDSRIDQAWFGRGDSFKRAAFEALVTGE